TTARFHLPACRSGFASYVLLRATPSAQYRMSTIRPTIGKRSTGDQCAIFSVPCCRISTVKNARYVDISLALEKMETVCICTLAQIASDARMPNADPYRQSE